MLIECFNKNPKDQVFYNSISMKSLEKTYYTERKINGFIKLSESGNEDYL